MKRHNLAALIACFTWALQSSIIGAYGTARLASTIEFRFERENCSSGIFNAYASSTAPNVFGQVARDAVASTCLQRNGIRASLETVGQYPLISAPGSIPLSDGLLGATGFALEVWVQLNELEWSQVPESTPPSTDPLNDLYVLVALQSGNGDYCTGIYATREENYEVVIYGYMLLSYEGVPSCMPIVKMGLETGSSIFSQPTQIVLTVRKDVEGDTTTWRQYLYIDTERILETISPEWIGDPFYSGPGAAIFMGAQGASTPGILSLFAA